MGIARRCRPTRCSTNARYFHRGLDSCRGACGDRHPSHRSSGKNGRYPFVVLVAIGWHRTSMVARVAKRSGSWSNACRIARRGDFGESPSSAQGCRCDHCGHSRVHTTAIWRSGLVGTTTALLLVLTGNAAAPEETTVYLLAGSADDPEPKTIFAPAHLIKRLKHLADPKPAVTEHAFLRAAWTGQIAGNSAEFSAQLVVYSFADRTRVEAAARRNSPALRAARWRYRLSQDYGSGSCQSGNRGARRASHRFEGHRCNDGNGP